MMMGDRERIAHQIEGLANERPEQTRSLGERRILMSSGKRTALFPMPAAWVRTNVEFNDGDLLILVGNLQSGIMEISNLVDEYTLGQECTYTVKSLNSSHIASSYLRKLPPEVNGVAKSRLIGVSPYAWKIADIGDYAAVATKATARARLSLIALPDKALDLANAVVAGTVGKGRWRVIAIPQWSADAIYYQLGESVAVAECEETCASILDLSGGFGTTVVKHCSTGLKTVSSRNSSLPGAFATDLKSFYAAIGLPTSISEDARRQIEEFVRYLDDGIEKDSVQAREAMEITGIGQGTALFLEWMGVLQSAPGNTWRVPPCYRRLLK